MPRPRGQPIVQNHAKIIHVLPCHPFGALDSLQAQGNYEKVFNLFFAVLNTGNCCSPKQELLKRAIYYVRSMCYMCGCLAIMRLVHCYYRRLFGSSGICPVFDLCLTIYMLGASMGLGTGFGCLAVMFEIESRQKEIFLFMLPRIMEICWKFLKRRHLVKSLPFAEHFIFAFAVGVVVDSVHRKIDSRASVTSAIKMILGKL